MNYKNDRMFSVDGTNRYILAYPEQITSYRLTIFGSRRSLNAGADYRMIGKIKRLEITLGSNIMYNFIPCYRISDGEIGMYDTMNNVFYTNQGTGEFIKGQDIVYVISSGKVTNRYDHTLYAIWKEN